MKKKIYAPDISRIEHTQHLHFGEYCSITNETREALNLFIERLNLLEPYRENEQWRFWVYSSRGPLEAFGDYEELHENGEYDTYEDYVRAWKEDYPSDKYWYEITVSRHGEYFALCINNTLVINLSPEKKNPWFEWECVDLISFLIEHVDKIICKLKNKTYNDWLAAALPYRYRKGIILRKKLWEINRKYRDWSLQGLLDYEIAEYIGYSNEETLSGITTERYQQMTTQKYFEICAVCYLAAKYEGAENMTVEQMYLRFADDRDGGLRTIDRNSPDEFDRWYALSTEEKWKIENPSHLWELRAGSSYTRIHLFVKKDVDGYYLCLSGGAESCTDELVRMYCALKRNNIPVCFRDRELIAKKIIGEDFVGIVPCTDSAWQYSYGTFPKKDVISFLSFDLNTVPEKAKQAFIENTEWFPIKPQRLKSS